MIKHFSTLTYPLCFSCVLGVFSSFAMIINSLMGADVRTPHGRQGDGDSAA